MAGIKGNAVIGQSGGPTAAINATLSGIISGALDIGCFDKIYGMKNGIEGFLREELIRLDNVFTDGEKLEALKLTPASALGSCRNKLPQFDADDPVYKKLFDIFAKYGITCFFYIGGNDSMDTVYKLSAYAALHKIDDVKFIGVPKTIDNDLVGTDHTPGFGSAAKYIAASVSEIARDCAVYTTPAVTIVEIMGRDSGWLTCAAALPSVNGCNAVDYIYLPENDFDDVEFFSDIRAAFAVHPNVVIAVSEGIRYKSGEYVGMSGQSGVIDAFGHKYLSGTGKTLERKVKEHFGCKVRSVEINILQRCAGHILSKTDIDESFSIGYEASRLYKSGKTGIMLCCEREDTDDGYSVQIVYRDINNIANKIKTVPSEYINAQHNGVTPKCVSYLLPLIQGEVYPEYENGLPKHYIFR